MYKNSETFLEIGNFKHLWGTDPHIKGVAIRSAATIRLFTIPGSSKVVPVGAVS